MKGDMLLTNLASVEMDRYEVEFQGDFKYSRGWKWAGLYESLPVTHSNWGRRRKYYVVRHRPTYLPCEGHPRQTLYRNYMVWRHKDQIGPIMPPPSFRYIGSSAGTLDAICRSPSACMHGTPRLRHGSWVGEA